MSHALEPRNGLHRLASRLRSGSEARIAVFGSSLSHEGFYLEPLVPALAEAFPSARIACDVRGLPGYGSDWAVFRTHSIVELDPDLAIVEFLVNDADKAEHLVARAVEGIVRQLRAESLDRDVLFVYFSSLEGERKRRAHQARAAWERVAGHYGVASFDGIALADDLVHSSETLALAPWASDAVALTTDLLHHTARGGRMLGAALAAEIVALVRAASAQTNAGPLPEALDRGNHSDALALAGRDLAASGWTLQDVDVRSDPQAYANVFATLAVAKAAGTRLGLRLVCRHLSAWVVANGVRLRASLNERSGEITLPGDGTLFPLVFLNEEENRAVTFELEALSAPLLLGAVQFLGKLV